MPHPTHVRGGDAGDDSSRTGSRTRASPRTGARVRRRAAPGSTRAPASHRHGHSRGRPDPAPRSPRSPAARPTTERTRGCVFARRRGPATRHGGSPARPGVGGCDVDGSRRTRSRRRRSRLGVARRAPRSRSGATRHRSSRRRGRTRGTQGSSARSPRTHSWPGVLGRTAWPPSAVGRSRASWSRAGALGGRRSTRKSSACTSSAIPLRRGRSSRRGGRAHSAGTAWSRPGVPDARVPADVGPRPGA